jgi:cytoplasmic iron level regulating protein YaaA (DUF328/UPF0246 family)
MPAPAEDLYCSSWFIKARDYARSLSNQWFILSAKHGLIGPQTIIEPYNQTLRTVGPAERRRWASMVAAALSKELDPGDRVVILAGATYRKYLVPMIEELGVKVEIPLEGKGIGEQLAWLKRHTA